MSIRVAIAIKDFFWQIKNASQAFFCDANEVVELCKRSNGRKIDT